MVCRTFSSEVAGNPFLASDGVRGTCYNYVISIGSARVPILVAPPMLVE